MPPRTLLSGLRSVLVCGVLTSWALLTGAAPTLAQQAPALPDAVPVQLDTATTAVLVQDITDQICTSANCKPLVQAIAAMTQRARDAGVYVIYSTPPGGTLLADVAPAPGEIVILSQGSQDRFYNTNLDYVLRSRGIKTVVLAGWRINGSILYTAFGATNRGYTVVVPLDGTSANTDFDITIGRYQIQNQSNANPTNEALRQAAVTLSRTDEITFQ